MKIEDEIQSVIKNPKLKALVNCRYTSTKLGTIQNKFMNEFDLSMQQFNVLRILRGAEKSIDVTTLKTRMIEKSPNTTRLLDKLCEKEFIKRDKSKKDGRVIFVEITEKGLLILREIDKKTEREPYMDFVLTDEESVVLSNLLDKLRSGIIEESK